jgi:hypothetical protein
MRHRMIVNPFFAAVLLTTALVSTGQKIQAAPSEDPREIAQPALKPDRSRNFSLL